MTGKVGDISFDWVIDASGRNGNHVQSSGITKVQPEFEKRCILGLLDRCARIQTPSMPGSGAILRSFTR